MGDCARILVLGIGNVLWADEGWGVRVVEEFHRRYEVSGNVRLMDGGTQGLYLVQYLCEADVLVVFDAIDYGLPPGTIRCVADGEVPKFLGAKKMSLHQTGFQEVIMTAELLGQCPAHMLLIGVQPEELEDFGGSLREAPRARMDEAIAEAVAYLRRHGAMVEARAEPLPHRDAMAGAEIALDTYEAERPAADKACRTGDPRFMPFQRIGDGSEPCA